MQGSIKQHCTDEVGISKCRQIFKSKIELVIEAGKYQFSNYVNVTEKRHLSCKYTLRLLILTFKETDTSNLKLTHFVGYIKTIKTTLKKNACILSKLSKELKNGIEI